MAPWNNLQLENYVFLEHEPSTNKKKSRDLKRVNIKPLDQQFMFHFSHPKPPNIISFLYLLQITKDLAVERAILF